MDRQPRQENIKIVKECAKELGFRLKPLLEEDAKLELYFDLYRGRKNVCCIYKGWEDPGFRISELLPIDRTRPDFKDRFYKIFEACSKGLINMKIMGHEGSDVLISFEIGIYKDGFNGKVLKAAVSDFEESMTEVMRLLN